MHATVVGRIVPLIGRRQLTGLVECGQLSLYQRLLEKNSKLIKRLSITSQAAHYYDILFDDNFKNEVKKFVKITYKKALTITQGKKAKAEKCFGKI